ncbi:hypothetical protein, partial [Motilimonas sp. KMU-193]|uniref:hypothetical protein n=1 Tax=Motilimonas sp. KMU-193 TaxID=3388668 RepID=UPI00396AF111
IFRGYMFKDYLANRGFKQFSKTSYICVRDEMLFTLSLNGQKTKKEIWFAIYPISLPDLWIHMGWSPAAGSYPVKLDPHVSSENIEATLIKVVETKVLPFFDECKTLTELEKLYSLGNEKAKYPQAFTLLAMGEYSKGQWALHELSEHFNEKYGGSQTDTIWKYVRLQTHEEIKACLLEEREKNIKKHKLVRHLKNANKGI